MITKEMTIAQALEEKPYCGPVFMQFGMHCLGCPISRGETVAQAAEAHGVSVDDMLKRLNEFNDAK